MRTEQTDSSEMTARAMATRQLHTVSVDSSVPPPSGVELGSSSAEDSMMLELAGVGDDVHSLLALVDAEPPLTRFDTTLVALFRRVVQERKVPKQLSRVLWLNLWGCSDQEISEKLRVTLHTVQDYQYALRRRAGVRSKGGYLRLLAQAARADAEPRDDAELCDDLVDSIDP
jgi:DNA-binding CsgD family transcriptional regulator